MSKHYATIAFTEDVRALQRDHGSQAFYDRKRIAGKASPGRDPLTATEQDYLAQRDSFYLATISSTGWPYVQFRSGPMVFCVFWTNTPSRGPTFAATCNTSAPATWPPRIASRSSPWTTCTDGASRSSATLASSPPRTIRSSPRP